MRARETFAAAGILMTIAIACGLSHEDRAQLAREGVLIGVCKSQASECGRQAGAPEKPAPQCWDVFDACLLDAGITITHAKDAGR